MRNFDSLSDSRVAETILVGLARKRSTQTHLTSVLNISQSAVHRRMSGEVAWRYDELTKIAEYLGLTMAQLVGNDDAEASA